MANETYNILQGIFNGQTPIQRTNPMQGQSNYYYMKPNQNSYTPLSQMQTVDVPSATTPNPYLREEESVPRNWKTAEDGKKVFDFVVKNASYYPLGYSIGSLVAAKKEMDNSNLIGGDNYYHRLAMSQIGQEAQEAPATMLWGLAGGMAKEGIDIIKKSAKGEPIYRTLTDSLKDMGNNLESADWGLQNPDKNNRIWLRNLDLRTNTWKNK